MINEDGLKKCTKCQQWLELGKFGKDKRRKDGLFPYCSECRRSSSARTKDKMLAKGLKYCGGCEQWLELECFSKNSRCKKDGRLGRCRKCISIYLQSDPQRRAHRNAMRAAYYRKHEQSDLYRLKEKMREEGFKYCHKCEQFLSTDCFYLKGGDIERLHPYCKKCETALSREHYKNNREHYRILGKRWRKENREKTIAASRLWAKKNPEKRRAIEVKYRQSEHGKIVQKIAKHRRRERERQSETFEIISKDARRLEHSPCVVCGSIQNIQWDHIIPVSRGGRSSIGNYQSLCKSCNSSKRDKLMAEWRYRDLRKHSQLS